MDKLNTFLKNNREKLIKGVIILGIVIVLIIVIFLLTKLFIGQKISYAELENRLIKETNNYLNDFPELKPTVNNPVVTIEADDLINNKYLKKLDKYTKDTCSAYVTVKYQKGNLDYQAFLNCNKYQTKTLNQVLNDNQTLSSTGEGIYDLNSYKVFRGQNPNNYVLFADMYWRIVKYNDNEIQLILDNANTSLYESFKSLTYSDVWDNRYNSESDFKMGINNFNLSIAFDKIKNIYNSMFLNYQEYLTPFNLCVGKKAENSTNKNGSEECTEILQNQNIGLLPLYDYLNASLSNSCQTTLSPECQNYNYLNNDVESWWTMTPNAKNTHDVYYVTSSGLVESEYANNMRLYRIVISLKGNVLYSSGAGTLESPYEIR